MRSVFVVLWLKRRAAIMARRWLETIGQSDNETIRGDNNETGREAAGAL
jgi:hypothetical protein